MALRVVDSISLAGGETNEDRAGARDALAWVIDGATDVVDAPLTAGPSDAAWLAHTLDAELSTLQDHTGSLLDLVAALADKAACRFATAATRSPTDRGEHPSAAGIISRFTGRRLDYVSLGDCALIAGVPGGVATRWLGIGTASAGDAALAAAISRFNAGRGAPSAREARRHIWPLVRERRATMNTAGGYGVFSITAPPADLIETGSMELAPDAHILLLTDGLARLVDVFARHTPASLLAAACTHGLAPLAAELRRIEAEDAECGAYPRAKPRDDATALLLALD